MSFKLQWYQSLPTNRNKTKRNEAFSLSLSVSLSHSLCRSFNLPLPEFTTLNTKSLTIPNDDDDRHINHECLWKPLFHLFSELDENNREIFKLKREKNEFRLSSSSFVKGYVVGEIVIWLRPRKGREKEKNRENFFLSWQILFGNWKFQRFIWLKGLERGTKLKSSNPSF